MIAIHFPACGHEDVKAFSKEFIKGTLVWSPPSSQITTLFVRQQTEFFLLAAQGIEGIFRLMLNHQPSIVAINPSPEFLGRAFQLCKQPSASIHEA